MEVYPWIINWISALLYERQVALRMGGWVSYSHIVVPGLPQEIRISPIIFNVYTASLAAIQAPGNGRILKYADDVLILKKATTD
jgi:hypothetical protein